MLIFTCPFCTLERTVREERVGKPIRCRGCEEVFTLTRENSRPEPGSDTIRSKKAAAIADPDADDAGWWGAAIEGALPGATAGVLAGIVGGAFSGENGASELSRSLLGLALGVGLGILLGGLAGYVVSWRWRKQDAWRHYPAPIVLGAVVGACSCAATGDLYLMGVCAGLGALAAAIWPLLGKVVDRDVLATDALSEDRLSGHFDPADDTRHYIDPEELKEARRMSKRRRA